VAVRGGLARAQARLTAGLTLVSPTDLPTVIALAVSLVMLARGIPVAIRAWQTYAGVSGRRQEDATGRAPTPDGELRGRLLALEAMGYRRIGETWTSTPSGGGFAWVLASVDEQTYVLLAQGFGRRAGLTGYYSTWRDGQWLGTMHPGGSPHESDGLQIRIEKGTLQDAEASHRAEVAAMSVRHGDRRRITALADVLALDGEYRVRFGGQELRPLLYGALFPVALWALLAVFSVVALFALP
jgi:hypothetical protein